MAEVFQFVNQEALKRFEKIQSEFNKNEETVQTQQEIIKEITESMDQFEEITKRNQELDAELEAIDIGIAEHSKALTEIMKKKQKKPNEKIGKLISSLLISIQRSTLDTCMQLISSGATEMPISEAINIEDEINDTIESLSKKGMFPETKEAAEQRMMRTQKHMQKVIDFIRSFEQ